MKAKIIELSAFMTWEIAVQELASTIANTNSTLLAKVVLSLVEAMATTALTLMEVVNLALKMVFANSRLSV